MIPGLRASAMLVQTGGNIPATAASNVLVTPYPKTLDERLKP